MVNILFVNNVNSIKFNWDINKSQSAGILGYIISGLLLDRNIKW